MLVRIYVYILKLVVKTLLIFNVLRIVYCVLNINSFSSSRENILYTMQSPKRGATFIIM